MHAIEITETGGPEVLRYVETAQPTPGQGELLIKTEAIGVNFIDTYFREGKYPRQLPFVLGSEACGTVAAVGEGVDGFSVGERVVSAAANGGYAEFVTAPAFLTATVPDDVTSEVAASVLLKGLTAHYLLKSVYPVQSGDAVLVHAGAGGVGLILTQWAHLLGARVITTVSTPEKERLSRQAGADEVLSYPDDAAEFGQRIRALTGGAGVAAVYDGVGATTFDASLASLADPRDPGAVRRVQRTGPAGGSAAPQRRRLGVSHPTRAGPLHAHRTGIQLACRRIVRSGRRRRHQHRSRRALSAGRSGAGTSGSAGPQDHRLAGAAPLGRSRARADAKSPICRLGNRRDFAYCSAAADQNSVGSPIAESTASAQNTSAR